MPTTKYSVSKLLLSSSSSSLLLLLVIVNTTDAPALNVSDR